MKEILSAGSGINNKEKVFVDIPGYEGMYEVSSFGNVRGIDRYIDHPNKGRVCIKGRQLSTNINKGYVYVRLCRNGIIKNCKVHRLVAKAFLPNPHRMPIVNHKNGVKFDNRVCNLEWCDMRANMFHAYHTGLKSKMYGSNNGASRIVLNTENGVFYESAKEASDCYSMNHSTLKSYLNGDLKNKTVLCYV